MKVKDFINGQFQGRHNNLIFYTRGNNTYVRRYAIPGKKRKWETEGRTPKQQAVAIRFKAVQVFYMTFAKQVSPEIWRAVAKTVGRPERVFLKKFPLLRGGRPNRRFREFHVHGRHFTSPQESESKRGRSSVQGHMARRTDVENRIRNGQITNRGII